MPEAEKDFVSLSCFRLSRKVLPHQPIPLWRGKVCRTHKLSV